MVVLLCVGSRCTKYWLNEDLPSPQLSSRSKPTSSRKPAISSSSRPARPPPIPAITERLPYHVHRTPSQQLPVYHLAKRGGNLLLTRLRKIDGDITKLKGELQQALGLDDRQISINQLTNHIIIKASLKPALLFAHQSLVLTFGCYRDGNAKRSINSWRPAVSRLHSCGNQPSPYKEQQHKRYILRSSFLYKIVRKFTSTQFNQIRRSTLCYHHSRGSFPYLYMGINRQPILKYT